MTESSERIQDDSTPCQVEKAIPAYVLDYRDPFAPRSTDFEILRLIIGFVLSTAGLIMGLVLWVAVAAGVGGDGVLDLFLALSPGLSLAGLVVAGSCIEDESSRRRAVWAAGLSLVGIASDVVLLIYILKGILIR